MVALLPLQITKNHVNLHWNWLVSLPPQHRPLSAPLLYVSLLAAVVLKYNPKHGEETEEVIESVDIRHRRGGGACISKLRKARVAKYVN